MGKPTGFLEYEEQDASCSCAAGENQDILTSSTPL